MVRLVAPKSVIISKVDVNCRSGRCFTCAKAIEALAARYIAILFRFRNEPFSLKANESGTVYVEFIIAFLPLFIFVLGIAQLAFIASAKAVVEHAAWAAARSAVVVLDDDMDRYGGVPRGNVRQQSSKPVAGIDDVMKTLNIDTGSSNFQNVPTFGSLYHSETEKYDYDRGLIRYIPIPFRNRLDAASRMTPIRAAAYMPLLPLANTDWANDNNSVSDAIHDQFFFRMNAALTYTKAAAAITLHNSDRDEAVASQPFERNSTVTARVVYLFSCDVPIARKLICRSLDTLLLSGDSTITKALNEAEHATSRSTVLSAQGRYTVLSGKSTLVNQSAEYEDREEKR
jgi:TadE-like protein